MLTSLTPSATQWSFLFYVWGNSLKVQGHTQHMSGSMKLLSSSLPVSKTTIFPCIRQAFHSQGNAQGFSHYGLFLHPPAWLLGDEVHIQVSALRAPFRKRGHQEAELEEGSSMHGHPAGIDSGFFLGSVATWPGTWIWSQQGCPGHMPSWEGSTLDWLANCSFESEGVRPPSWAWDGTFSAISGWSLGIPLWDWAGATLALQFGMHWASWFENRVLWVWILY